MRTYLLALANMKTTHSNMGRT